MNLKDIIFLPLELPRLYVDYDKLLEQYNEYSVSDSYRNCKHIPLCTSHGSLEGGNLRTDNLVWTDVAVKKFPEIIGYVEKFLKPWMNPLGRVAIICTQPGEENPLHIDCDREKFDSVQLKFRQVLHGNTDDLIFTSKHYEIKPEDVKKPFVMAGEWPHRMINTTDKIKFTLAVGAPWECEPTEKFINLLQKSRTRNTMIHREELELPDNWESLFYKG